VNHKSLFAFISGHLSKNCVLKYSWSETFSPKCLLKWPKLPYFGGRQDYCW